MDLNQIGGEGQGEGFASEHWAILYWHSNQNYQIKVSNKIGVGFDGDRPELAIYWIIKGAVFVILINFAVLAPFGSDFGSFQVPFFTFHNSDF